jgi:hypothetical protein
MDLLDTVIQREPKIAEIFDRTRFSTRVAWITDISERALPETYFMRYARSRGGQGFCRKLF